MADRPIRVVRDGIHRADGEQRPLKGGHAVEGHACGEEFEHRVGAEFVPSAAQSKQTVEHAPPGRCPEHQAENHAQRLQPLGKGGVQQMVRPGPDVDEDEGPEVDDRKPVTINRTLGGLRQVVIHDAEDRSGKKERDGVVAIPPLDERVLHTPEDRVSMGEAGRPLEVVDDVEHRHRDNRGDVEPDGDIEGLLVADGESPEKVDGENDPDQRDRDVDRPDELRVFLAARKPERQRDGGGDDDELPTPEMQAREEIRGQPSSSESLGRVVDAREDHVADEGKNRGVRVQWPESAEGQPRGVEVQEMPAQLRGDDDAEKHADHPPENRCEHELPHHLVVVFDCPCSHGMCLEARGAAARPGSGFSFLNGNRLSRMGSPPEWRWW